MLLMKKHENSERNASFKPSNSDFPENLGLTSIPPLIFELYYLKSCNFTIIMSNFFPSGRYRSARQKWLRIVILNTCIFVDSRWNNEK